MNIRPLHDRVVIQRLEEEESEGGSTIVLPDSVNKQKSMRGSVLAVGNGTVAKSGEKRPLDVKVGDRVVFGQYAGTEVKMGGEEYLMMREEDIMGVVEA